MNKLFLTAIIINTAILVHGEAGLSVKPYNVSDAKIGYYEKGHFGKSLAISNDGPEYPVFWLNSKSSGGTMSYWFKPTRPCRVLTYERLPVFALGKFYVQAQLPKIDFRSGMGDGKKFRTHARSFAKGRDGMTISVCGKTSKIKVSDDFYDHFHHVAVTWTTDTATIYFDGEVLGNHKLDSIKFEPKTMGSLKTRGAMNWLDEMLILRKPLSADEIKKLYQSQQAWTVDASTAFYAGFDGSLASSGMVPEDGALPIAYTINTGAAANVYPGDTVPAFNVTLVNPDSKPQSLAMRVKVEDLAGKTVFDKSVPVTLKPKAVHYEKMEFAGIGKGLFYSDVKLVDANGRDIKSWHIVFAATDAVRSKGKDPYDVRTGFVFSRTYNPVAYASWIRLCGDSQWYNLEYAPGKWDFARLDMLVNEMLNDGRSPQLNLSTPPVWRLDPKRINHIDFNLKDLSGWKDYVTRVATRYKGRVFNYEILNEPYFHTPVFSAQEYGQLCAITADILHKVDPKIKAIPAFGGYPQWRKTLAKVTAKKADFYAIHPYSLLWNADIKKSGNSFEDIKKSTTGILKEAGANQVLVDTEVACYTLFRYALKADGRPMTCEEFDASGNWDKMGRLREYGRQKLVDYFTGAFRMIRLFTMERALNSKYTMYWAANVPGVNTMVAYADHPTPMSAAYANLSKLFYGKIEFLRLMKSSPQVMKFLFKKQDKLMAVVWLREGCKEEKEIILKSKDSKLEIKDYFGRNVQPEKIGSLIKFKLKPLMPLFVFAHDLTEAKPAVEIKLDKEEYGPEDDLKARITLNNPFPKEIRGTLEVSAGDKSDWKRTNIIIPASGNANSDFTFPRILDSVKNPVLKIRFMEKQKYSDIFKEEFRFLVKKTVKAFIPGIRICADGRLAEWPQEAFLIKLDSDWQLIKGVPYTKPYVPRIDWKGPDDLSASAAVAIDNKEICIAIHVTDDILTTGDAVNIYLDGRTLLKNKAPNVGIFHIRITPPLKDFPVPKIEIISPAGRYRPQGGFFVPFVSGLACDCRKTAKGYDVELKLPLSNLRWKPGSAVPLNISIADYDKTTAETLIIWIIPGEKSGNLQFGEVLFNAKN